MFAVKASLKVLMGKNAFHFVPMPVYMEFVLGPKSVNVSQDGEDQHVMSRVLLVNMVKHVNENVFAKIVPSVILLLVLALANLAGRALTVVWHVMKIIMDITVNKSVDAKMVHPVILCLEPVIVLQVIRGLYVQKLVQKVRMVNHVLISVTVKMVEHVIILQESVSACLVGQALFVPIHALRDTMGVTVKNDVYVIMELHAIT